MARLAVLGRSALYRAGIVSLLNKMGFDQVEDAVSINELKGQGDDQPGPDIVLISLSSEIGGTANSAFEQTINSMEELKSRVPAAKIVFLVKDLDLELLFACFSAGASGLLLENISRDAFEESLRLVCAGEKVFPSKLAALIPDLISKLGNPRARKGELEDSRLSDRELDILRCLTNGQTNKVIAKNLNIAESTVKVHVKRILQKIHASNRTQAALWGAARGVVVSSSPEPSKLLGKHSSNARPRSH